jgi:hypothetical protein
VRASSATGIAIIGVSESQDAINGTSSSPQHAGISANNTAGGFGLWASSPSGTAVRASSATGIAIIGVSESQDAINGTSSSPQHAGVSANNTGEGYGLWAKATTAGRFEGNVEITGTTNCGGDHNVAGTINVQGDIMLLGADCAEQFTVSTFVEIDPGTVMVISKEGNLEPSHVPYDKKVAGIVSGAGGFKPGIILDNQDSDENRVSIALVGKVYCKVDAQYGAIEVGDLLTTSLTTGHAMKVDDAAKAFGATIGKALESLQTGQGLIPILIALQ